MGELKKTKNHQPKGEYKKTILDDVKKTSNRLVEICGKYRTVITAEGEKLRFENKMSFNAWSKNNSYVPDF